MYRNKKKVQRIGEYCWEIEQLGNNEQEKKGKGLNNSYYFVSAPSDGAFLVPASGHYFHSRFIADLKGVDHQKVVDEVLAFPHSMRDLIMVDDGYGGLKIHQSLLPEFLPFSVELIGDGAGGLV